MRVLHLSPTLPWPLDSGGRIGIWNYLRTDARFAEVMLLTLADGLQSEKALAAMAATCQWISTVPRPPSRDGLAGAARSLVTGEAMNLAKYQWPVFAEAARRAVDSFRPDVVVAHHLHMGPYLVDLEQRPAASTGARTEFSRRPATVLREHNVDSVLMRRFAERQRDPARRAFAAYQARRIEAAERRIAPAVDRCFMITRADQEVLSAVAPSAQTAVVPAVVEPREYPLLRPPAASAPPVFATGGTLNFPPTADGVVEFAEEVWPAVRRRLPGAVLRIFGTAPPDLAKRLRRIPQVDVLGHVPDLQAALEWAAAFVVWLRAGSGVRIRILEAMAMGLPVVSTAIGAEGIEAEPGRHLLLAETAEAAATALARLVEDPPAARALAAAGRRLVEERYSPAGVEPRVHALYDELLREVR